MSNPRFGVGDRVLVVSHETVQDRIAYPDCGGTRFYTVTMFDGIQHTLDCPTCEWGFEGPHGYLRVYKRTPLVLETSVSGVRMSDDKIEYDTPARYGCDDDAIFAVDQYHEAEEASAEAARQAEAEERQRLLQKDKPKSTWAWNASYHRRELSECLRRAKYHEGKLAVAQANTKAERSTTPGASS